MKLTKFELTKVVRGSTVYWSFWVPAKLSPTGKRKRNYYKTKGEAVEARSEYLEALSGAESPLPTAELVDAKQALRMLAKEGVRLSLSEVVAWALEHLALPGAGVTVAELLERFAAEKEKRWRKKTADNFRFAAGRMRQAFGELPLVDVSADRLAEWLAEAFPEDVYRKHAVSTLRPAFSWAKKRGLLAQSPFSGVDVPTVGARAVRVYSPAQARALLEADVYCRVAFALLLFAGVRPQELERLTWGCIRLDEGFIHVPAGTAKTRQARIVEIEPNLAAILAQEPPHAPDEMVRPKWWKVRARRAKEAAGAQNMGQDVARHSYASYWLALHRDENRLKANMGHSRNSETLFVHYRAAATRAAAAEFWRIGL